MKNILSSLNEGEKRRILEMYYKGSAKRFISEQKIYKEGTYSYKVENNKYYYSTDDGKTWTEQTKPTGIQAIKDVIAKQGGTATTGVTTKQGGTEKTQTAPAKTEAKERVTGLDKINKSVTALNKWAMENPITIDYDPAGVYVPNLTLLSKSIKENRNADKFKTEFTYPYGLILRLNRSNGGSTTDTQYMTLKKADCFKDYKFDWDSGITQGGYQTINDGITKLYNGFYKGNQRATFCGFKDQYFSNRNGVSAPAQEIQNLSYNIFDARLYSEPLNSWNFL